MKQVALLMTMMQLLCASFYSFSQDSLPPKKEVARNFGLFAGASYSLARIVTKPYFTPQGGKLVEPELVNNYGASIGLFVYKPLREKWSMRVAAEANLMNCYVQYETGKSFIEKSYIYPVCVELPFTVVYGRHYRVDLEAPSFFKTGLMAGIRPVIPISLFHSSQPIQRSYNLNVDIGISRGMVAGKAIIRTELFFSLGLLNVVGKDTTNFKTNSIENLLRHFVGLRLYFN